VQAVGAYHSNPAGLKAALPMHWDAKHDTYLQARRSSQDAEFTTKVTLAECCKLPDVPVIVTVELPAGVDELVEMLTAGLPEPLTDPGLKLAVAPVGKPLAPKVTVPVNPFSAPIVAV
jgi:hypothetical protein